MRIVTIIISLLFFGVCFSKPDRVVVNQYSLSKVKTNTQKLSDSCIVKCNNSLFFKTCITYKNNKEHGLWERYFRSGEIKARRYYNNGEPTGQWTIWDKSGFVLIETNYESDTIIEKTHLYNFKKNIKEITIKSVITKGDRYKIIKTEVITKKINGMQ